MNKLRKLSISILSLILLTGFLSPTINVAAQEVQMSNIIEQPTEFLNDLKTTNQNLSKEIEAVEARGYSIDPHVKTIDSTHVVVYESNDGLVTGMIQVTNGEVLIFETILADEDTVDYAILRDNHGSEIYIQTDENGEYIYEQKQKRGSGFRKISDEGANTLCNIVMSVSGTSVATVYSAVAGTLGGPVAAFAVGLLHAGGWGYLSGKVC